MQLIADMHTHSLASGHAYGTIREMAQAAAERGLRVLGITDHAPGIPGTCDPFYFNNLRTVPRVLSGVEVYHGSEVNVLEDGTLSLEQKYINKLDYCIVGIHKYCFQNQGAVANTERLIACMQNPKIRFVTHPDDDRMPLNYPLLVSAAQETHTALEINNSSLVPATKRIRCRENYRTLLALCKEKNVPVIVSSDAHDPSSVGSFDYAMEILSEADFPEELVLNTEKNKLLAFLL